MVIGAYDIYALYTSPRDAGYSKMEILKAEGKYKERV
jgi:hypothetical protein